MKKNFGNLTISKNRGKKKLIYYPGTYVEEEKVFVHFSAVLSMDVMEVKVWQNFSLAVQKLQTQFHSKSGFGFILFIAPWKILSLLNTLF